MNEKGQKQFSDKERECFSFCLAVVGSGSYALRGMEYEQVKILCDVLRKAKNDGVDWKRIYSIIYERWHTRRPLLPDLGEMAALIEERA